LNIIIERFFALFSIIPPFVGQISIAIFITFELFIFWYFLHE